MKRFILICTCVLVTLNAHAQFGKNKVQYSDFTWYYIQSAHFDVYFTDGGEYLARFTADVAEHALEQIQRIVRHEITARISVMVFNSHNDFQQNNVVSEYLPEGVGGVTELYKNRVVLPFEGSYELFRHVIHHELVHAVLNDMFYGGSIQSIVSNQINVQLPIWMNEGLAEYCSLGGWDVNSDMFLRDASINEYLPELSQLEGYFAYRGGESFWWYVATKYGEEKIGELLNRIRSLHELEAAFKSSFGMKIEDFSTEWRTAQKKLYWPDIAIRENPKDFATRLTDHRKIENFYNTSPAISPNGDKVAFISDRNDYFDVFIMDVSDPKKVKRLVSGNTSNNYEELHLLTPGLSWSPDGKKIALSTKAGDEDAIMIVDVDEGEKEKLSFGLDGIYSLDWSPDGNEIVFIGNSKQQSDMYLYNLSTKSLTNLTNDLFTDGDPVWTPDGKSIYFTSDRGANLTVGEKTPANFQMLTHDYKTRDIYRFDISSSLLTRITTTPEANEGSIVCSSDGKKLLFVSDRNGIGNIYVKDLSSGAERALTNSLSGIYQTSLSRDGMKLVFASLDNAGFDIFLIRAPFEKPVLSTPPAPTKFIAKATIDSTVVLSSRDSSQSSVSYNDINVDLSSYSFANPPQQVRERRMREAISGNVDTSGNYVVRKYKLNFTPDLVYGTAGYNPFYGLQGVGQMLFSDMLGNHQIFAATNLNIDLANSDVFLQYAYLPERTNYAFSAFHSARFINFTDPTNVNSYITYRFRYYGASTAASRPFDKFNRVEGTLTWMSLERKNINNANELVQDRLAIYPSLSYIHDDVLWGYFYPVKGTRSRFTVSASPKLGVNGLGFISLEADYRQYFRLSRDYSFALRLSAGSSYGPNPPRFFIGGTDGWLNREFEGNTFPFTNAEDFVFLSAALPLRGYNFNKQAGTNYFLTNIEFRFPLIRYLVTGLLPLFFQNVTGNLFFDAGSAFNTSYAPFIRRTNGSIYAKDLLMGTGTGLRIIFLGFLVRLDIAWQYTIENFSPPRYMVSLGIDY